MFFFGWRFFWRTSAIKTTIMDSDLTPKKHQIDFSKAVASKTDHVFKPLPDGGLRYSHDGIDIEVLGDPKGLPTSLLVGLRLYRSGERSSYATYRIPLVDLFDGTSVGKLVSEASRTLEIPPDTLSAIVHGFIDLLEAKTARTAKMDAVPLDSAFRREAMAVLCKGNIVMNLAGLMEEAGMPDAKLAIRLYLLSLSRMLDEPLHGILHGDADTCGRILSDLSACLPKKQFSEFTAISPHALSYPPKVGYWKHRTLVLYGLDGGNKSTLTEYLLKGRSRRLIAHRDEKSGYRSREQALEGPIQLLATTDKDLHPAFYSPSTVTLPVETTSIAQKIYETDIRRLAGLEDTEEREHAQRLLQSLPSLLSPMVALNPLVEQISLEGLFGQDLSRTGLFLRLSHLIALLDQYNCGMERLQDGREAVIVEAKHMALALELFSGLWIKNADELHFRLRGTHKRLVELIAKRDGQVMSKKPFTAKEVRKALGLSPATLQRHLSSLRDYGILEICGGNRAKGYRYRLVEHAPPRQRKEAFDNLLDELQGHGEGCGEQRAS